MSQNRKKNFATCKQKVKGIKFHENSNAKMSREFKAVRCWKGRKCDLNISCFASCYTKIWHIKIL